MTSEDKLASQMGDLTTDATPIPHAEVAVTPQSTSAVEPTHNLSEESDSQESDEPGELQGEEMALHEDRANMKPVQTDEVTVLDRLSSHQSPEGNISKSLETSISDPIIEKEKKSATDKRIAKSKNSGLLQPGPPAVVYNITEASNVHVGPVVTVNLSSSQAKSPQMAAPKKTKEIADLLHSITPISEEDIDVVSPHVGHGWRKVGRQLKFTDGQLDQFEANFALEGRKEVIYQMLIDWKRAETDKATRGILCSALWSAKQYDPVRILAHRKMKCET